MKSLSLLSLLAEVSRLRFAARFVRTRVCLFAQGNQQQQNSTMYHQDLVITSSSESPHQQQDFRYIEVGDGLPIEEGQLNGLGSLGGVGLNIPLNLQECEVESNELDQYLRPQVPPVHIPAPTTTSSQWVFNR